MSRRFVRIAAVVAATGLAAGCRDRDVSAEGGASAVAVLHSEDRLLTRSIGDCETPEGRCSRITIRYPEFTSAATAEVRATLNRFVLQTLLAPSFSDQPAATLEERMDQFVRDYQEFRAAFPDARSAWTVEEQVTVPYRDDRLITLLAMTASYTGGAHPNEQATYATFSLKTGERVTPRSLLNDDYEEPLRLAAERAFRHVRQLDEGQSLTDAGFQFENGEFKLSENFGVVRDGLLFYYNAYDVAPYALGPTQIVVPWADVAEYVLRGGPYEPTHAP